MHQYIKRLIGELNIPPDVILDKNETQALAILRSTTWKALCALASTWGYAGDERWLAALAQKVKREQKLQEKPQADPYWSLWGKLKAARNRIQAANNEASSLLDEGITRYDDLAEAIKRDATEEAYLTLPNRRLSVTLEGMTLTVTVSGQTIVKRVKGDLHAVNFLRKLDSDDSYFGGHHGA